MSPDWGGGVSPGSVSPPCVLVSGSALALRARTRWEEAVRIKTPYRIWMRPRQVNYSQSPLVSSYSSNLATVRRMTITNAEFDIIYKVDSLWTGKANGSSIITLSPEGLIGVIVVALVVSLLFKPLRFRISSKRRIILLLTEPVRYALCLLKNSTQHQHPKSVFLFQ